MSWTILDQSVTGETQWFNASYGPALSTVADALVGSITQNTNGATANTYAGIVGISSGLGNGAIFTIVVGGGGTVTNITVTSAGSGYAIGDTITIANGGIGGGGTDLIITLIANDFVTTVVVPDNATIISATQNVAGYSAGTISFTIRPAPNAVGGNAWASSSTLEMTIIGGIDTSSFIVQTLVITEGDTNTTFYVDWAIQLQNVALQINNNTTTSTGKTITVSALRMQVETGGGGIGYVSSSGTTTGPGGVTPQIQFNDGGVFNGAAGAEYDKLTNTIHLGDGSAALPMLAFSDGTFPAGNFDTGIYRQGVNQLGISAGASIELVVSAVNHISAHGGAAATPGYNFGITGTDTNTGMYRIAADTVGISTGSVQKMGVYPANSGPFINGLNVGTTGAIAGIRRLSGTADNSWEDGHMGNSAQLVFTPTDFIGQSAARPTSLNSSQPDPGGRNSRWYGTLNQAGVILAQKVIPKGFRIGEDQEITIFTPAGSINPTICYVSAQSVDIGGTTILDNLLSDTNFASNSATSLAGGGTVVGDGKKIITIYWDARTALTNLNSPSGAIITMIRV